MGKRKVVRCIKCTIEQLSFKCPYSESIDTLEGDIPTEIQHFTDGSQLLLASVSCKCGETHKLIIFDSDSSVRTVDN